MGVRCDSCIYDEFILCSGSWPKITVAASGTTHDIRANTLASSFFFLFCTSTCFKTSKHFATLTKRNTDHSSTTANVVKWQRKSLTLFVFYRWSGLVGVWHLLPNQASSKSPKAIIVTARIKDYLLSDSDHFKRQKYCVCSSQHNCWSLRCVRVWTKEVLYSQEEWMTLLRYIWHVSIVLRYTWTNPNPCFSLLYKISSCVSVLCGCVGVCNYNGRFSSALSVSHWWRQH